MIRKVVGNKVSDKGMHVCVGFTRNKIGSTKRILSSEVTKCSIDFNRITLAVVLGIEHVGD